MANYSLVIGSKFSPFTYEELLKAPVMATQAHQEIEAGLSDLAAEANVWEEIANEQTDPYAYSLYKKYADDLSAQAELLASKGLTPESRSALSKMKSRYSSEITPIKNAYTRRQALATEQREARNKDATMLFDRDIATMSLDDFIKNPETTYTPYSGALIASQVGTAAKSLAKVMRESPREWKKVLNHQYYETMMQKGYSPEEVLLATLDDPKAPQDLRNIVENVIASTGIRDWDNPEALQQAYDYAKQGLWESIGETSYQMQTNRAYDYAMEEAAAIRKAQRDAQGQNINTLAINPINIFNSKEQGEAAQNIKNFSKYFTKDAQGNTVLTEEGMKEYRRVVNTVGSASGTGYTVPWGVDYNLLYPNQEGKTPFREFMDTLGVDELNGIIDNWNPRALGSVWDKYLNDNNTSLYDASKVTEYDIPIDSENQDDAKNAILTALGGKDLEAVEYDSESKTFKPTKEKIKTSDLNNTKYKVVGTRISPYGSTVMIKDDEGNVRRYRMPVINPYRETARQESLAEALAIQEVLKDPTLTDIDRAYLQIEYKRLLNDAHFHHSQLYIQNKTKAQEYSPVGQ